MGFKFKHLVFVTVVITVTTVLQIGEIYLSRKLTPASRTMREAPADPCPTNDRNTGCKCTMRCTSPSTETPTTTKPGYWTLTPTSHRSRPPTTTSTITTPLATTRQTDTSKATTTMAEVSTTTILPETTSKRPTTWYPTTVTEAPTTTTASPTTTTNVDATTSPQVYQDCRAAYNDGKTKSGVYRISPDGDTKINVYCEQDLDGGGWAVFQRRVDGTVQFNHTWANYKRGFGSIDSEYWLGNDLIHLMTMNHDQRLKVEIEHAGLTAYPSYSEFWIKDEKSFYRLNIGGFSHGDIDLGDPLAHHNQRSFSTYDGDHDTYSGNCAASHGSGWWFGHCSYADLNGVYSTSSYQWHLWSGHEYPLTASRMMMKTK